jgi:choline dehydrogenase-like flavoprotein
VRLAALIEQLPSPDNRVTLADETDALGLPRPRISYSYDDYVMRGVEEARNLAELVFDGLGATERTHVDTLFGAGHIIGTHRIGTHPATSVTDPTGRTHDHPNLYLASSGLFPTAATANPTLTIAALALMSAGAIQQEVGGRGRWVRLGAFVLE